MPLNQEREVCRELARHVVRIAAQPVQQERIALWKDFNALKPTRPMVLCFPEGSWPELVTAEDKQCFDPVLGGVEWQLRLRIFQHERIGDDQPITNVWHVPVVVRYGDYGLTETRQDSGQAGGSWHWDPPLKDPADVKKLHPRSIEVDWDETEKNRLFYEELLGDIMDVRVDRSRGNSFQFPKQLFMLRGDTQVLMDMYDQPQMLHDILAVLQASAENELAVLEREGALRLNNAPDSYCGTGGIGCTDELPAEGFDGRARPIDLWALGESQEYANVSAEHYDEFSVRYHAPLLNRFGLSYYGCCEALHRVLGILQERVTNLRALSLSPWCDREVAAEMLGDRYLAYWKPNPALTCGEHVDWQAVERLIDETLGIMSGCRLAMVLKDTHTFCHDKDRPGRWVKLARRLVEQTAGA